MTGWQRRGFRFAEKQHYNAGQCQDYNPFQEERADGELSRLGKHKRKRDDGARTVHPHRPTDGHVPWREKGGCDDEPQPDYQNIPLLGVHSAAV